MGLIEFGDDVEMDVEQQDGEIQKEEKRVMFGTRVYKWVEKEMLFTLGSILKQMSLSRRTLIPTCTPETIKKRVMWNLIKTDKVLPWGWAKLSISKLCWTRMIGLGTSRVVVLGLLGEGADGKGGPRFSHEIGQNFKRGR